jgi:hypothetical protein
MKDYINKYKYKKILKEGVILFRHIEMKISKNTNLYSCSNY